MTIDFAVDDKVRFIGYVADIPKIYAALDVFVLPSRWEGFGLVLLEAMAAGKPIVATRVGAIPEVVVDGETGVLIPAGDPLALAEGLSRLAMEPGLARQLGDAGRERLRRRFSVEKMVGDTELLYRELLEERVPRR